MPLRVRGVRGVCVCMCVCDVQKSVLIKSQWAYSGVGCPLNVFSFIRKCTQTGLMPSSMSTQWAQLFCTGLTAELCGVNLASSLFLAHVA